MNEKKRVLPLAQPEIANTISQPSETAKTLEDAMDAGLSVPVSNLESKLNELTLENAVLKAEIEQVSVKQLDRQAEITAEIRDQAYNEAYKDGLSSATDLIQEVHELERHFLENQLNALKDYEEKIVEVVLASVGKILGNQIIRPEIALAAVKEVLHRAGHQEHMRVHVSPKDHQNLEKYRRQISPANNIDYIADDRVKIGGCLVELDRGMLDGRIEIQLQTLVDCLSSVRQEH